MSAVRAFFFLFLSCSFLFSAEAWPADAGSAAGQDTELTLPPIVKDASPVDSLSQDPVVPAHSSRTQLGSGEGSILPSFTDELPYAVTDSGTPGSLAQFRGLGRSAEDMNVQALGIPLNLPQGGGFDFSSFPQFFWSQYSFAMSPSMSALDTRGVAGTVSLTPWTEAQLSDPDARSRWTALDAGSSLQQLSIGAKYGDRAAVLAGNSSGLANGPSGQISARVVDGDDLDVKLHLIATRIDTKLYGFGEAVSPEQTTARMIPVAQLDWHPRSEQALLVKSSVFYDNTYTRYDDVSSSYFTRDRAQQFGTENGVFIGDWRLGVGSRTVNYTITGFTAPLETTTNAVLSRALAWETGGGSRFIVNPSAEAVYVTSFGTDPQGSLGLREEWGEGIAAYFRGSYSRRFPSLADRFYNIPATGVGNAIGGNPGLMPEQDWTYVAGLEGKTGIWSGSLEGYYQVRDEAEVPVTISNVSTNENLGQARIASLTATGEAQITSAIRLRDSASFNRSRVDAIASPFPYIPDFVDVLGADLRLDPRPTSGLSLGAALRASSSAFVSTAAPPTGGTLPGAVFLDAQAAYGFPTALPGGLQATLRVENVTGGDLVLTQGYPPKNRVVSVALVGGF